MNIKNIIFDLGGVLIGIDYHATIKGFTDLGLQRSDEFFGQLKQHPVFDQWDIGGISPEEFRDELRRISGLDISDHQIDNAWNAMLGSFPPRKFPLLQQAATHYRTFLLSNTNAIHIPYFKQIMLKTHGVNGLDDFFEKIYYSHEVGMRKPDPEIYRFVCRANDLDPSETLFFDDTHMHVAGAREAGLWAYWIDLSKEDVVEYFHGGKLTDEFLVKLQNQSAQSDQ